VKKQAVPFAVVVLALLYSFLVSAYSYVPVTAAVPTAKGKAMCSQALYRQAVCFI